MNFTTVNKAVQSDLFEIVKYQLVTHCFLNKIVLNETEMNCLALLGMSGEMRLIEFCKLATENGFLGNPTAVNNCLARVEKSRLFIKKGAGKKVVFLNPELGIQTKGNIMLNYKIFRVEADPSETVDRADRAGVESTERAGS